MTTVHVSSIVTLLILSTFLGMVELDLMIDESKYESQGRVEARNNDPVISLSLTTVGDIVVGDIVSFYANASDADDSTGESLTYSWSRITTDGNETGIHPCNSYDTCVVMVDVSWVSTLPVTVIVTDPHGGEASDTLSVSVWNRQIATATAASDAVSIEYDLTYWGVPDFTITASDSEALIGVDLEDWSTDSDSVYVIDYAPNTTYGSGDVLSQTLSITFPGNLQDCFLGYKYPHLDQDWILLDAEAERDSATNMKLEWTDSTFGVLPNGLLGIFDCNPIDWIEFPQVNGMVLNQLNLNAQDLDFSPELTAPTPDGGIVVLLSVGDHSELESWTFGDLEIQTSSLEGTYIPEGELCSTHHGWGPDWEGHTQSWILLWANGDGELYEIRELNLSDLPNPDYGADWAGTPCRRSLEPMSMEVRFDGLIGIAWLDKFDWYDGITDGYQLVAGYYNNMIDGEQNPTNTMFDMGVIHTPGIPDGKCYNPLLREYADLSDVWGCGFEFEFNDYGNSTECQHIYFQHVVYFNITQFECESFMGAVGLRTLMLPMKATLILSTKFRWKTLNCTHT